MLPRRHDKTATPEPQEVCAGVLGYAQVQVTPEQVAGLRKNPGPWQGDPLPPTALKYSDEQTLTGLVAVLHAMDRYGLKREDFKGWGILACPRFIGRSGIAPAFEKFKTSGASVIQPNLIPHRLLHALSGTLSQTLKIYGPNLGVGGGPLEDVELLQAAASFLASGQAPGYWLVFTGYEPECIPDRPNAPAPPWVCHGLALALSTSAEQSAWQLRIGPPALVTSVPNVNEAPELLVHTLGNILQGMDNGKKETPVTWQIPFGPRLTLAHADADTTKETILAFPQRTYRVAV
jgi:hypothetical protein